MDRDGLGRLIALLRADGRRVVGPPAHEGAIVHEVLDGSGAPPEGWHDEQSPGRDRLCHDDDAELFSWAVGPTSPKPELFLVGVVVFRGHLSDPSTLEEPEDSGRPVAFFGLRRASWPP